MRLSKSNEKLENNVSMVSSIRNSGNMKVDYPLNGPLHPSTVVHHQTMKELFPNEIRFTSSELIGMLDSSTSRNYHNSVNRMKPTHSLRIPRAPKGLYQLFFTQPVVQNMSKLPESDKNHIYIQRSSRHQSCMVFIKS